jgi:hypothetical protein
MFSKKNFMGEFDQWFWTAMLLPVGAIAGESAGGQKLDRDHLHITMLPNMER